MESGFHEQSQTQDMIQEESERAEVKQWQLQGIRLLHHPATFGIRYTNVFKRDSVCDVVTKHPSRRAQWRVPCVVRAKNPSTSSRFTGLVLSIFFADFRQGLGAHFLLRRVVLNTLQTSCPGIPPPFILVYLP